jgi:hypothetical protein
VAGRLVWRRVSVLTWLRDHEEQPEPAEEVEKRIERIAETLKPRRRALE